MYSASIASRPRVLMLYGGWEGHTPDVIARHAANCLLSDTSIFQTQDLSVLCDDVLSRFDLFVPIWTFGDISRDQEAALLNAVERGLGVVAWHGNTSAFLNSRLHKFLLGGQFVEHPGGAEVTYRVEFQGRDPLVAGLKDFSVTTEQYYMLVDPAVEVLATTRIDGAGMDWLAGVQMPVAWKRSWGAGRVFYCTLGHTVNVLSLPSVEQLIRRAATWATRQRQVSRTLLRQAA